MNPVTYISISEPKQRNAKQMVAALNQQEGCVGATFERRSWGGYVVKATWAGWCAEGWKQQGFGAYESSI